MARVENSNRKKQLHVAFLHPDLGLGGAERLIVDAAVELVRSGHKVDVHTAYYDPQRCFEETKTGGFTVAVSGNWFPRHLFGRFLALCAYIRCILVALHIAALSLFSQVSYDLIIVDQVSAVIPFLKLLTRSQVLFYCHFPDMLLAQRRSLIKRIYRAPIDAVEAATTGWADRVLVNSRFTASVFADTFTRLHARGVRPGVLYPAVAVPAEVELTSAAGAWERELEPGLVEFIKGGPTLLSINRFERKKGIGLAVTALKEVLQAQAAPGGAGDGARLVLAGGYDLRVAENVEHLQELKQLVEDLGLQDRVRFLPSFTDRQRTLLLSACTAVVYTPQHEHFGIVPLEAMAAGRPVLAVNNGGPTESVVNGNTGLLCDPTPAAFAAAYTEVLKPGVAARMGAAARQHVASSFSREAFGKQLDVIAQSVVERKKQ